MIRQRLVLVMFIVAFLSGCGGSSQKNTSHLIENHIGKRSSRRSSVHLDNPRRYTRRRAGGEPWIRKPAAQEIRVRSEQISSAAKWRLP